MRTVALLPFLTLVVACEANTPVEPPLVEAVPEFAHGIVPECAVDPDWIVDDADELYTAMEAAQEGDVIAVEGVISTAFGAYTYVNGITLTCATPGAGIVAAPDWDPSVAFLLRIFGNGVSVTHLFLDAAATPRGPIYGFYDGTYNWASHLVFTDNDVVCGPGECLFFAGVESSLIADNRFESDGGGTGIHVQGAGEQLPDGSSRYQTDNTRILRNTVVSVAPSPISSGFGGIRVRDGSDHEVSGNVVIGPWSNSLSPSELRESTFSHNTLRDAQAFGVLLSFNSSTVLSTSGNEFRYNEVSGAHEAGVFVTLACGNAFLGNRFKDNGGDIGVWFDVESGGNLFLGNSNTVVNNGDFDCGQGGPTIPNVITGPGLRVSGLTPGDWVKAVRGVPQGQGEATLK